MSATPATIYYDVDGVEQVIRCHAVISEDHHALAEITKFPVQTGFVISNHSIRKNRVINIEGIITNTLIRGANNSSYRFTQNNSKTIFSALKELVNSSIRCRVVTNLGLYDPVVFNNFATKQQQGMTDAMLFRISGEEIQEKNTLIKKGPAPLSFEEVPEEQLQATQAEFVEQGMDVPVSVETASTNLGEDFQITNTNNVGQNVTTTYKYASYDPSTKRYIYEVHTSDTSLALPPLASEVNAQIAIPNIDPFSSNIKTGFNNTANCLIEGSKDFISDTVEGFINTGLGMLEQTVYGAKISVKSRFGGNPISPMVMMGIGCAVEGVVSGIFDIDLTETYDTSMPTVDDVKESAKDIGLSAAANATRILTPTSISKVPEFTTNDVFGSFDLPSSFPKP